MTLPVVHLRAIEPEDLDDLYNIENDEQLWGIGETNVPYSRYLLHQYVACNTADIYADRQMRLMVENLEGETVGIIDLVNFEPRHLRAEIGIVIDKRHRRKGYAQATILHVETYARDILHLHQLYAIVGLDNEPSLNLFNRLHFQPTATLRDWLFDGKRYADAKLFQTFL